MKRSHTLRIALTLALIVPLATLVATAKRGAADDETAKVVTEAENGSATTLGEGEVLVVRLKANGGTGYSRALVSFPDMPIRLVSHQVLPSAPPRADGAPVVGAPRMEEWKFAVEGEATYSRAVWLKLLNLRPFAKGVETAGLWEIKVTVPPQPSQE